MNQSLTIVKLDAKYCSYLRKFDNKVPYNYGKKELRPFVGVLFKINNLMYYAPLSSPKSKHFKMKSKIDFLKIDNGKLGAVNFNNMLPVTEKNIIKLNLNKVSNSNSEKKYLKLLREQLFWLNRNKNLLQHKSKKLYDGYVNGLLSLHIMSRCCNFKLLEEKCNEYNNK